MSKCRNCTIYHEFEEVIPMGTTQPIRKDDELYSFRMYYADEKPNVRNYTLIVLGLNTALRIGDLLSLKWSSVYNFQFQSFYDHILIHEQKTGKRNNVLLNATAKDALQAYFNERSPEEGEYIFTKNRSTVRRHTGSSKLPQFTPHRKTASVVIPSEKHLVTMHGNREPRQHF